MRFYTLQEEMGEGGEGSAAIESTETVDRPEHIPEKFWDSETKSVRTDDVLKSYSELEKRFGSFTGAPEEYQVFVNDDLKEKGFEIEEGDLMLEKAMEFAKERGMNQDGFNEMVNLYGMVELAKLDAQDEFKAQEIKALGNNAQSRLDNLVSWGQANLSDELYHGFEEMIQTASAVQALEKLISMTRNAPVSPEGVQPKPGISSEELRAMQFEKDEFGNRRIQTDPEFRARFDKLSKEVWGSENHTIVIGR